MAKKSCCGCKSTAKKAAKKKAKKK